MSQINYDYELWKFPGHNNNEKNPPDNQSNNPSWVMLHRKRVKSDGIVNLLSIESDGKWCFDKHISRLSVFCHLLVHFDLLILNLRDFHISRIEKDNLVVLGEKIRGYCFAEGFILHCT